MLNNYSFCCFPFVNVFWCLHDVCLCNVHVWVWLFSPPHGARIAGYTCVSETLFVLCCDLKIWEIVCKCLIRKTGCAKINKMNDSSRRWGWGWEFCFYFIFFSFKHVMISGCFLTLIIALVLLCLFICFLFSTEWNLKYLAEIFLFFWGVLCFYV